MWVSWFGRSVPVSMVDVGLRFDGERLTLNGQVGETASSATTWTTLTATQRKIVREQIIGLSRAEGRVVPAVFDDAHLGRSYGDETLRGWWRIRGASTELSDGQLEAAPIPFQLQLDWVGERPVRWHDVATRADEWGTLSGFQASWGFPAEAGANGELVYSEREAGPQASPSSMLEITPAPTASWTDSGARVVRCDQLTSGAQFATTRSGVLGWSAPAEVAMAGACYVASFDGTVAHPTDGRTIVATRSAGEAHWEIGNGLVRVRLSPSNKSRVQVQWWDGSSWAVTQEVTLSPVTPTPEWVTVEVTRNSPEAAEIRLVPRDRRATTVAVAVMRGRVSVMVGLQAPPGEGQTTAMTASLGASTSAVNDYGVSRSTGGGTVSLFGRGLASPTTWTRTTSTGTITNAVLTTARLAAITCGGLSGLPSATWSREEIRASTMIRAS